MRTHDYDYPESEMDERESLYFDTISLADSEAAAAAAHRKSLSQSRNTIYHSAVDLAGDETRNSLRNSAIATDHMRLAGWQPGYRQSTALEHLNGDAGAGAGAGAVGVDHTDAAIAAQLLALQNGRTHLPTGIGVAGGYGYSRTGADGGGGNDDEVSRRLLRQSSTVSNRDKKLPITYSQWKLRVNNDKLKTKINKKKETNNGAAQAMQILYANNISLITVITANPFFVTLRSYITLSLSLSLSLR